MYRCQNFFKNCSFFYLLLTYGLRIREILACSKMQKTSQTKTDFHAIIRFKLQSTIMLLTLKSS